MNMPMYVESFLNTVTKHKEKVIIGALVLVAIGVGLWGYRSYQHRLQVDAHHDFMQALKYFQAPVQKDEKEVAPGTIAFKTENEKWAYVEEKFRKSFEQHRSTGLAPMFQAFRVEALLSLGKHEDAISVQKEALADLRDYSLKGYYEIKLSLMQLDSAIESNKTEGLERLKKTAYDQKHSAHAQALFYLGQYFWINKKFDGAKNYWQQFIVKYGNERTLDHFVDIVKEKLELIAV